MKTIEFIFFNVFCDYERYCENHSSDVVESISQTFACGLLKAQAIANILHPSTVIRNSLNEYSHSIAIGNSGDDYIITYAKPNPCEAVSNKERRKRGYKICTGRMKNILNLADENAVDEMKIGVNDHGNRFFVGLIPKAIKADIGFIVERGNKYFKPVSSPTPRYYVYYNHRLIEI